MIKYYFTNASRLCGLHMRVWVSTGGSGTTSVGSVCVYHTRDTSAT
jgi:hypothetical protein